MLYNFLQTITFVINSFALLREDQKGVDERPSSFSRNAIHVTRCRQLTTVEYIYIYI
jgi:hypothetical protein